jgi:large subunit ribosomal protein L6e
MPRKSRNPLLIAGVERYSRSAAFKKTFGWKKKKPFQWKPIKKTVVKKEAKAKPFGKSTRVVKSKGPKYYPEVDVPHKLSSRKNKHQPTRLRKSITPGTVLILVSGRFKGHRVVFLRQLRSGLLLITGPYRINGVPLRRVCQSYVIATSAKVDLSGVKIDDKFTDKYFKPQKSDNKKKQAASKKSKSAAPAAAVPEVKKEETATADDKKKDATKSKKKDKLPQSRVDDQKALDKVLIPLVKKTPLLKHYLRERFSLRKGQYPHILRF